MKKLKEEYCRLNGWIKRKGILLDTEAVDDSYSEFFIADDCKSDYYKEVEMWCEEEGNDEGVFDDEDIVEHIEDFAVMSFEEYKKKMGESSVNRTWENPWKR